MLDAKKITNGTCHETFGWDSRIMAIRANNIRARESPIMSMGGFAKLQVFLHMCVFDGTSHKVGWKGSDAL